MSACSTVWRRARPWRTPARLRLTPSSRRSPGHFPDRVDELVERLPRGLAAADPEVAGQAFFGLYRWLEATSNNFGVPGVPDDLIAEVGRALEVGQWVFKEGTSHARELIGANCDIGLTYLISEASYEAELRSGHGEASSAALLRRNSTMLALAMGPGFLDHRPQRLLRHLAGLEERREEAALPQLRDAHLQRAQLRVERTIAVTIAPGRALAAALVAPGANQAVDIGFHQQLQHRLRHSL
jgi:hypothetical protein